MQRPRPETVTLENILITEELSRRSPRSPNWQAEAQAMRSLARQMARDSASLIQTLVDIALKLCQAGTAGVSLLETTPNGEEIFRWNVLAGTLAHHVGGSTPRNFSPCGVCLEQGSPVLFSHPEQYFTYFQEANTPIVEGLVLPLIADNHALGTIWIMSHDEKRQFASEDVRVMTSLADFTATALLLKQRQTGELLAVNAALEAEIVERRQAEERFLRKASLTRALIENLPGGAAFVVDRDLRYLLAEGEALAIAGFKPEDFVGHTIFEVLPPELAANYYEVLYRRALAGEPFEHEHHAHDHTYVSRGTPLRAENGEIYAVLAVSYDISDRKLAEATLRKSEERFRLFVTASSDIVYRMSADWREMRRLEGKNFIVNTENPSQTWIEIYIPQEEQLRVWAAIQNAIRTKSTFELEHRVIQQDGAIGWTFSRAIPMLNEQGDIVEWLGTASNVTDRKQAEEALHESEEKYRALFNSIDEGFHIIELMDDEAGEVIDYRFLEGNPAFERLTGLKNAAGKLGSEIAPRTEAYWLEAYDRVARTGEPLRIENYNEDTQRWYSAYASRVGGVDSRQVAIIFDDITDRKRAEANLAFLAEISQDLARQTSIDETMKALGEKIGGYFNLLACVFAELSETAEIAVINYTWQLSHMPSFVGTYRMQDFVTPEVLRLCRAGEAVVIRDVFADPLVDGEQYAALNIGSFLSIPLVRDGEWRFLLVIYHTEPYDWRDDEIELTHELANRIWTRLERAHAEEQLRRAAEMDAFRVKLSDALRSLTAPVEIQVEACRLLGEQLGVDRSYYVEVNEAEGYWRVNQNYLRGDSPTLVGMGRLTEFGWTVPLLRRGEAIVTVDVERADHIPEADRAAMAAMNMSAHITMPLLKGALVGALCVTESAPREWLAMEVELVRETAERIWATIERERTEDALRESEIQRIREQSAREEARQRAETLAELDRAKTLFFSNVSHEFRTPLTLSLAPLQDALSDQIYPLAPPQRERLELAQRNATRLLKLVNTLLDFSRIEAGRMEAVYEPTDLALFTTELASVFRSTIERAGLRLIVDCPALPESVYVDREMWEKIVLNLLSNAFKFTLEGEIAVRLHRADSDLVQLQIQDTGTGIAPEELPHLFERFYQVRGAKARTHEGSGIGLALVQELIKMHGGTVEVSSTVGQGTCFTITIPFGTSHLPSDRLRHDVGDHTTTTRTLSSTALGAAPYVEEAERWLPEKAEGRRQKAEGKELHPSSFTLHPSKARILLVDDNADIRDYLTRILSEYNQVISVADGAAALAAAQAQVPDLILTDVMMPGLDGFELLKALRADPRTKEVPIVLLSARAGEESIVEGLEAGADDYLIKPFSAQELVSRVNAHLQMAHLRGEALRQERTISRRKDELLSTVSHELNTPLVAILGWTRFLRANPANQSMLLKSLETIERNATLQAKLIEDLLDISRITAGKLHLNLQPVELQAVIEMAIATVHQTQRTKDIQLECILHPLPTTVQGDPDRLQQIVLNLLTNAVKFTPKGGIIQVRLDIVASQAEVVVSDTGKGISAEFLPHVFDSFRQADSSSAKGLGLGLAIARSLVELHGGSITAASPGIGQGTTFTINLPLIVVR